MNKNISEIPEIIEQFIDVIWMERGLSENTLAAYRTDLKKFVKWLISRSDTLLTEQLR